MTSNNLTALIVTPIAYIFLGIPGVLGCVIGYTIEYYANKDNEKINHETGVGTPDSTHPFNIPITMDKQLRDLIIKQRKIALQANNRTLIIVILIWLLMAAKAVWNYTLEEYNWMFIDGGIAIVYIALIVFVWKKRQYYKQRLKEVQED